MDNRERPKVLYILREDLNEPLIKSQVLSYFRGLIRDYEITVIELKKKTESRAERSEAAPKRVSTDPPGVHRVSGRFRRGSRSLAGARNLMDLFVKALREIRRSEFGLVHARSYMPAAVAWILWRLYGIPYIFDMRALWLEELIVRGRIKRSSVFHRILEIAERRLLGDSAAIVLLTEAAVAHLQSRYPQELTGKNIEVIPTCADLDRFTPSATRARGSVVHGCIGTVLSSWFRIDWLASWFSVAAASDPDAQFEIVTRDDPDQVRRAVDPEGLLAGRLHIGRRPPEGMPEEVRRHHLSIMFFTEGLSKLGSCPTRMGEVLGCGLPVVANAGVGDVAGIIRENRVGVLVEGPEPSQIGAALDGLSTLMQDPELPARCRATAEKIFSLEGGTGAYRRIYASVLRSSGNGNHH